jgi:fructan beta-fructosidase
VDLLQQAAPGTISPTAMELELTLDPGSMGRCGVELSNARGERYRVGFDATQKLWFSDRTQSGDLGFSPSFASTAHTANRAPGLTGLLQLRLFFDANSAELFADDGALQMTESFYPSEPYTKAMLYAEGQGARLVAGRMHRLGRVWP